MKKLILISTLLVLFLTACSAVSNSADQTANVPDATTVADIVSSTQTALAPLPTLEATNIYKLSTDYENAAPVSMQLVIGITQLENTDLAITSEQAASLLTILNFLKDLSTNTSATQEQFDALMDEAQLILTTEQITAIASMKITQDTAMTLLQQQKSDIGNPPMQGDMPQGTPPAGGPGGRPSSEDAMGTPPADGMQPQMGFIPPQLLDVLIQLMESKTASS